MQIKRFEAPTMTEALRQVKAKFGSDAVILSARTLKGNDGLLGYLKKPMVEVTAATDTVETTSIRLKSADRVSARQQSRTAVGSAPTRVGRSSRPPALGAAEIRRRYTTAGVSTPVPPTEPDEGVFSILERRLERQGVAEMILKPLLRDLKSCTTAEPPDRVSDLKPGLLRVFEKLGLKTGRYAGGVQTPEIIVFLGPTGVGKTTTMAKLAAVRSHRMKRRVGLIALDDPRIGASVALERYAAILNLPLRRADDAKTLYNAIRHFHNREVILIDTPGVSPFNKAAIDALQKTFSNGPHYRFHLVQSATTHDRDLNRCLTAMQPFALKGLIFTKLDETGEWGNLLNLMVRSGLPLEYLCDGPDVTEHLHIATLDRLAERLIAKPLSSDANRSTGADLPAGSTPSHRSLGKRPPATVGPSFDNHFVANRNSDIFHFPSCKWVRMIKPGNMIVFQDVGSALNQNYKPCRSCRPRDEKPHAGISRTAIR